MLRDDCGATSLLFQSRFGQVASRRYFSARWLQNSLLLDGPQSPIITLIREDCTKRVRCRREVCQLDQHSADDLVGSDVETRVTSERPASRGCAGRRAGRVVQRPASRFTTSSCPPGPWPM